jgi:hypothetical protein
MLAGLPVAGAGDAVTVGTRSAARGQRDPAHADRYRAVTPLGLQTSRAMRTSTRAHEPRLPRRTTSLIAVVATSAMLIAACGGSSSPGNSARSRTATTDAAQAVVAFADCMRSRGLSSYPDPQVSQSGNRTQIKLSPGRLDLSSPTARAASRACGHLLPDGGSPPSTISPQQGAQDLQYAACMRSKGVPGFPDPDHDGVFTLPSGVDQQAPQFQRATRACMALQPSSISIFNQNPNPS